ncbi:WYL domain-containing protein [Christensenellaceae bacterium OttesenSCG-928-M15]|nr:WYL domain-containing protein [Christensenellaceae bacterium OttesenSCG-928-M15]
MAYAEWIKSFSRVRDYLRDFLLFGYRTREDFRGKSVRTYDDQRRRIESYLSPYMQWTYGTGGKRVFLSVDSAKLEENPLYRAYRAKSFTDNDIVLHFFLLDILREGGAHTVDALADTISDRYGEAFEALAIRRKLKEYVLLGLCVEQKAGARVAYALSSLTADALFQDTQYRGDFLAFFSEAAPFSVVGSYLREQMGAQNTSFQFKHHFISHTLDDEIALALLYAMEEKKEVRVTNSSARNEEALRFVCVPLQFLTSAQNGRRYLICYDPCEQSYMTLRLDYIKKVEPLARCAAYDAHKEEAQRRAAFSWGTVYSPAAAERLYMTILLDEEKEPFILQRLQRERRIGKIEKLATGEYRFSVEAHDTNELGGWLKSYTGRIKSLEGDNANVIDRFYDDMQRMLEMYREE